MPSEIEWVEDEGSDGHHLVVRGGDPSGDDPVHAVSVVAQRRALPVHKPTAEVGTLVQTVQAVNSGAGLWARSGGLIGNSEVAALKLLRPPTAEEIRVGADPAGGIETTGYEALSQVFDHASLDIQTEIYRRLDRKRPWWARFDIFGWFKGARAPVERFEEVYEPGGNVELFVMGHDHGSWLFPKLFKRHFSFTKGGGDWMISRAEVTRRGGDIEAELVADRGYARSLIRQFEDMTPAQRWRALTALEPELLDSPITLELERIDPTWFDPNRFGVAVLFDPYDHERGDLLREGATRVREFFLETFDINPYLVEEGFDLSFIPESSKFPEVPSEPIHQFAVDLRELLPRRESPKLDLLGFADFMADFHPRWPRLTPEQIQGRVKAQDYARFVGKRVDVWGWVRDVDVRPYSVTKRLRWSSREFAGTDSKGRPRYRTRTSTWRVQVPAVRIGLSVVGTEGAVLGALWDRQGDAQATGHHSHYITQPDMPIFESGRDLIHGTLSDQPFLVM